MHFLSSGIALCAFIASVSKADWVTVFTSTQHNLNVTLNGTTNGIEFGPGSPCRYWTPFQVAKGVKDWTYYSIQSKGRHVFLRFPEYVPGTIAQPDRTPSLFRVERDGGNTYVVSVENEPGTERKLAWTAERNGTVRKNMVLKLRSFTMSNNQRFSITQEYMEPPDC